MWGISLAFVNLLFDELIIFSTTELSTLVHLLLLIELTKDFTISIQKPTCYIARHILGKTYT